MQETESCSLEKYSKFIYFILIDCYFPRCKCAFQGLFTALARLHLNEHGFLIDRFLFIGCYLLAKYAMEQLEENSSVDNDPKDIENTGDTQFGYWIHDGPLQRKTSIHSSPENEEIIQKRFQTLYLGFEVLVCFCT